MENAETNIVAALITLVTNTGLGRFSDTSTLIDNWQAAAASIQHFLLLNTLLISLMT